MADPVVSGMCSHNCEAMVDFEIGKESLNEECLSQGFYLSLIHI